MNWMLAVGSVSPACAELIEREEPARIMANTKCLMFFFMIFEF
jgi:hypothetical protein